MVWVCRGVRLGICLLDSQFLTVVSVTSRAIASRRCVIPSSKRLFRRDSPVHIAITHKLTCCSWLFQILLHDRKIKTTTFVTKGTANACQDCCPICGGGYLSGNFALTLSSIKNAARLAGGRDSHSAHCSKSSKIRAGSVTVIRLTSFATSKSLLLQCKQW